MKDLIITIFGATGDLSIRKLLPALTKLYISDQTSKDMEIIAIGRRSMDTDGFLDYVKKNVKQTFDLKILKEVITYKEIQLEENEGYELLKQYIHKNKHDQTREIYYLAVGPELFPIISKAIHDIGLITKGQILQSIAFEKPFGHDLESAKSINALLWQFFDEKQIYRIDHYLGKEMIQNMMTVRFANRIFEDIWHNRTIKNVMIIAKETEGILGRSGYYDQSGALKDMVQSHLLQMVALTAMEVPMSYHSEDVKDEKVKVLNHLTFDQHRVIMGQYDGYLQEQGIHDDSKTETFVFIKLFVNTPRFKGVPFYLITGKKLSKKESQIIIEFEETLEQRKWNLPLSTNKLHIKIAPLDGVGLILNSKIPGLSNDVEPVELEYCMSCHAVGNMPEAYEKLLLDMTNHHKSLFTRWDEIELSWKFIDQIKHIKKDLIIYKDEDDLKPYLERFMKE